MRRIPHWLGFVALAAVLALAPATRADSLDSLFSSPFLSAASLERTVLERNPSLAAMRSAQDALEARAEQERAWDVPMVDVMVAPASLSSTTVDPAYAIGVSQTIPIFGDRALRSRATRAMARSAGQDVRTVRLDLLLETRRLFGDYYLAARGLETNQEVADLVGQARRVAIQKYAAGTVGQQDALQAEVELAMLEHERVALVRASRTSQARLRALLHDDSSRPLPPPPATLPIPEHAAHADSNAATSQPLAVALANRPEIRGRSAAREALAAQVAAAQRRRRPELTFEARYDRFMEEKEWRPQVGLAVSIPFGWGGNGAGVREASAELTRAEREREAAVDSVRAEVEAANAAAEEAGHELRIVTERVVPATERALASTRAGYESNRSDFLALLNAARDLAKARLARHQAEVGYHLALSELERALGTEPDWVTAEERR